MTIDNTWRDVQIGEYLDKGWAFATIALELGLTCAVVAGVSQRRRYAALSESAGVPVRDVPPMLRREPRAVTTAPAVGVVLRSAPPDPSPTVAEGGGCILLELNYDECRWPTGADEEERWLFCGAPAAEGRSYCSHHAAESVGRGTTSERSAHRAGSTT